MVFNINELEGLEYDLGEYGGTGVIPEPSTEQIDAFRRYMGSTVDAAMSELGEDALEPGKLSQVDQLKLVSKYLQQDQTEITNGLVNAVHEVCSKHFTQETLHALPARVKTFFFGWLVGVLLDPEASTPATK